MEDIGQRQSSSGSGAAGTIQGVRNLARRLVRGAIASFRVWPLLIRRSNVGRSLAAQGNRAGFYLDRFFYMRSHRWKATRASLGVLRHILRLVVFHAAVAALLTCVLAFAPFGYAGPQFLATLTSKIASTPGAELYLAILTTAVATAGAFLALYFTAVSVVASTGYARVTHEIRQLVLNDEVSGTYVTLIAHGGTVALFGLFATGLGAPRSHFLLFYVTAVLAVMVLAFIRLGNRIFAFFDPDVLAHAPLRDLHEAIILATPASRTWLKPAFQAHAQKQASAALGNIAALVKYAVQGTDRRNDVALSILRRLLHTLTVYHYAKSKIPTSSLWYQRRTKFESWGRNDFSSVGLAISTGTTPTPKQVPDESYLEDQVQKLVLDHLVVFLESGATEEAISIVNLINEMANHASRSLQLAGIRKFLPEVRKQILIHITRQPELSAETLQLCELYCVAAIAPILHTSLELERRELKKLISVHDAVAGESRRVLYEQGHPLSVLRELEDLRSRHRFERDVEGEVATAAWFSNEVASYLYADFVRKTMDEIAILVQQEYLDPVVELIKAKSAAAAAIWVHRGLEACAKATRQLGALGSLHKQLGERKLLDRDWRPVDEVALVQTVSDIRTKLINALATLTPQLIALQTDDRLPDFIGNARTFIGEDLISRMHAKDYGSVGILLRSFQSLTLAMHDRVWRTAEPGNEYTVHSAMDLMLDAAGMSGLVLLYGELDGNAQQELVFKLWDALFKTVKDPAAFAKYMLSAMDGMLLPIMSPSAMRRQEWNGAFAASLRDRGIRTEHDYFGDHMAGKKPVRQHPSDIIEASAHCVFGHLSHEPFGLFAAIYLLKQPFVAGLEIPMKVETWTDAIARVEKRYGKES